MGKQNVVYPSVQCNIIQPEIDGNFDTWMNSEDVILSEINQA
jgi:hypothetical protein